MLTSSGGGSLNADRGEGGVKFAKILLTSYVNAPILTFALTETFSANICNICIASIVYCICSVVLINYFFKHLLQHYKSIIFIEDDTEGIIM